MGECTETVKGIREVGSLKHWERMISLILRGGGVGDPVGANRVMKEDLIILDEVGSVLLS